MFLLLLKAEWCLALIEYGFSVKSGHPIGPICDGSIGHVVFILICRTSMGTM